MHKLDSKNISMIQSTVYLSSQIRYKLLQRESTNPYIVWSQHNMKNQSTLKICIEKDTWSNVLVSQKCLVITGVRSMNELYKTIQMTMNYIDDMHILYDIYDSKPIIIEVVTPMININLALGIKFDRDKIKKLFKDSEFYQPYGENNIMIKYPHDMYNKKGKQVLTSITCHKNGNCKISGRCMDKMNIAYNKFIEKIKYL